MSDESHLLWASLRSLLLVEQITAAEEWLALPPVCIHPVDCCRAVFTIDNYSLIDSLLVLVELVETNSKVDITSLDDLHGVSIDLADRADSSVLVTEFVVEGPASCLRPVKFAAKMVLGHYVLVGLKSE